MRKRTIQTAIAAALSLTLAGCSASIETQSTPSPIVSPKPSSEGAGQTAKPSPSATVTPVQTSTSAPAVTPTPAPTATPKPTPTVTAAPSASPKPNATAKPGTDARTPFSWYYMKKKKGQVPDFPHETKRFTSDQKAAWVGTGKKVYLTIDAGGPLVDVDLMMKSLKDNDVKATFFIAGYTVKKNPEYVKRLVEDGHLIANHTMTHKDFNLLTDDEVKKEIKDFEKLYKEITGDEVSRYFRFPYGRYSMHLLDLVSEMGYTSVFWSTAMRDWEPRKNGAEDPYNDIMNNLHDGNVILMHQGSKENMEALDRILKDVKKAGYEFALVNDGL